MRDRGLVGAESLGDRGRRRGEGKEVARGVAVG
jgi:hypothetical protein